ncbi:BglG family transcription antiterminator [Paenibacillus sp. R14(2021)]|uniref:BglG family transcription antiterminator n=1 Tax=Paenibacillus sp. R14(2021) TaxID=2859228 RepID=UPI001C6153BC|nr:BglG family transcription antiterminator [Paenibacillus sp. R14(2021)]
MIVSNRQRRLLEVLLKKQEEVTAGELAEELQISARTVHREIQELENVLAGSGLQLIRKSGIGITLQGSDADIAGFKERLGTSVSDTFASEERKVLILCQLLEEEEPVKLYALAHAYHAAIPTVTRDLDELEPLLRRLELELIRRRGYGVEIAGKEAAKRSLIALLAQKYLDDSELFGSLPDAVPPNPVIRELHRMTGKSEFLVIEQQLWKLEESWPRRLSEMAYTRLLIRLSVAIARMREKHEIEESTMPDMADAVNSGHQKLDRFLEGFDLAWPAAEKAYIGQLLDDAAAAAEADSASVLDRYGLTVAEAAVGLIRTVGKKLDVPFDKDRSLLDGLVKHLGPALEHIRASETIRNPLLQQIKKDYAPLFAAVRSGVEEALQGISVPDEEIGYLVMHFGASIERWKMFPRSLRALLVCTSGIGSSKLLAVRISKEIPQIELIGHYSWYEAARIPPDRYDFIVSTVDLPMEQDRYVKLSPLLTREELEKLRGYIWKLTTDPISTSPAAADTRKDEEGALDRLKRVNAYTSEIVGVLDQFDVHVLETGAHGMELRGVLSAAVAIVAPAGCVKQPEAIVQQLIDRENSGTQLIADTHLALFHTRSEWVSKPVLSLFRLTVPLQLGADDTGIVRQFLLMLAPHDLSRPGLEVLSEISAMLLLPEMVRLLEEDGVDAIKAFMSQELEDYMRQNGNGENPYEYLI